MNNAETKRIVKLLYVTYPRIYDKSDDEQLTGMIEVWKSCFADELYSEVAQALKYYFSTDTSGFPPVIGKLKEAIYKMHNVNELTELDAWNYVKKALKNSIYNAQSEFDNLPDIVKDCVGSAATLRSWAVNEADDINTVIASNFQRSYKARSKNYKEVEMLPNSIKNIMGIGTAQHNILPAYKRGEKELNDTYIELSEEEEKAILKEMGIKGEK